jgi:hypothetical protein
MSVVHRLAGFVIVGGLVLFFLWGLLGWLARRDPGAWYWRLLAVLQVLLVLQLLAGTVLLVMGRRQSLLHYAYGALGTGRSARVRGRVLHRIRPYAARACHGTGYRVVGQPPARGDSGSTTRSAKELEVFPNSHQPFTHGLTKAMLLP